MKYLIPFLLYMFCAPSFAQMLQGRINDAELPEPYFNPDFIRSNKIKVVRAMISVKPDNAIIEDEGLTRYYEFDTLGNIIRNYYTLIKTSGYKEIYHPAVYKRGKRIKKAHTTDERIYTYDTLHSFFYYDTNNRLLLKRKGHDNIFMSHYFEYNPEGNMIKDLYCKETNVNTKTNEFKLGMQNIISIETFTYEKPNLKQVKKKCMNDQGRVYKEAIATYDENGRLAEENYQFSVSWVNIKTSFSYDKLGRLNGKVYRSNTGGQLTEFSIYEYTPDGNLLTEKNFRNENQVSEKSYLYDEKGKFLKSQVERIFENKIIEIVKYSYEFRDPIPNHPFISMPPKSLR